MDKSIAEKSIEAVAKGLHAMQVESAKWHDEHTKGVEFFYLDWTELTEQMRQWYYEQARAILALIPQPEAPTEAGLTPDDIKNEHIWWLHAVEHGRTTELWSTWLSEAAATKALDYLLAHPPEGWVKLAGISFEKVVNDGK